MPRSKQLELKWPLAGVGRRVGFHDSANQRPPYFTPWSTNCRPEDVLGQRLRGGSRPGLTLYADDLDGGVIDAILSVPIATSSGVASKLAVVADNVLGVFDGGVYIAPTGDLLTEAGVEITTEADVNILVDTGGVPGACFLCSRGQKVYAVASAGIVSLDLVTGAVDGLTATAGTTPTGMTLGCVYRDRLVVAGADNAVYMSRQGDFADWDFGADVEDSGRAVAFQLGEAAEHGALTTAVVPFKDASILLATEYGLWVVNGDPAAAGTLRNVSRGVGIIGSTAWCLVQDARLGDRFVKNGIVFLGRTGLFVVAPSGDGLRPITEERIPEELIDVSLEKVSMVYSPNERGVYIFLTFDDMDAHIAAEIDNRSAGTADLDLFASAYSNGGANPWSTTCWAKDFDFSGVSPYNDENSTMAGTLISPRHVLFAEHHDPAVGAILSFVRPDGTEYLATLDSKLRVATTDLMVGYLTADVPPDVPFYKTFLTSFTDVITLIGTPTVICDQEEKALIGEIINPHVFVTIETAAGTDSAFVMDIRSSSVANRSSYWEDPATNDSGHPTFVVINGELVLLGIHFGRDVPTGTKLYDTAVHRWRTEINTRMTDLDGGSGAGYQLTAYEASALSAAQSDTHWFYDLARDGFWPIALQADHRPLATAWHDGQVVLAGKDGNLRYVGGDDDHGSTIESHVLIGPLRAAAPGTFGRLMNLRASIAASSGAVRWRIVTGDSAENACARGKLAIEAFQAGTAYGTYVAATGGLVAGRNGIAYPRTRTEWFCVWLESTAKWGYETMMIETGQSGKVR